MGQSFCLLFWQLHFGGGIEGLSSDFFINLPLCFSTCVPILGRPCSSLLLWMCSGLSTRHGQVENGSQPALRILYQRLWPHWYCTGGLNHVIFQALPECKLVGIPTCVFSFIPLHSLHVRSFPWVTLHVAAGFFNFMSLYPSESIYSNCVSGYLHVRLQNVELASELKIMLS